jgi:hypothetical protein
MHTITVEARAKTATFLNCMFAVLICFCEERGRFVM